MKALFGSGREPSSPEDYGVLIKRIVHSLGSTAEGLKPVQQLALGLPTPSSDRSLQQIALRMFGKGGVVWDAWKEAEALEKELSRVKPPSELARFHDSFLKGLRALILGHGGLARAAMDNARSRYSMASLLFKDARLALQSLQDSGSPTFSRLGLDPLIMTEARVAIPLI